MGSLEDVSIASEGLATLILAALALAKARQGTLLTLGILWLGMALFDFSLLWKPEWETWRDMGSYWLFIAAMARIWIFHPKQPVDHPL
jgi:hypothetical protein